MFGLLPEGLAWFWAVDPAEANSFRAFVVEDFNCVAVEDTNHLAGELASHGGRGRPQGEEHSEEQEHRSHGKKASHVLARKLFQRLKRHGTHALIYRDRQIQPCL